MSDESLTPEEQELSDLMEEFGRLLFEASGGKIAFLLICGRTGSRFTPSVSNCAKEAQLNLVSSHLQSVIQESPRPTPPPPPDNQDN